jgi:hypothetical protein
MEEIKGQNPAVTSALPIGGSVILTSLKAYSKREVQYKAGYSHISNTEKYTMQELDGFEWQLTKRHLFG